MTVESEGNFFVRHRLKRNLTATTLCAMVGISTPTYSKLENDEGVSRETIKKFADALHKVIPFDSADIARVSEFLWHQYEPPNDQGTSLQQDVYALILKHGPMPVKFTVDALIFKPPHDGMSAEPGVDRIAKLEQGVTIKDGIVERKHVVEIRSSDPRDHTPTAPPTHKVHPPKKTKRA